MPNMIHACFYCNCKGHISNTCYIWNFGIPNGKYVWVEKGTNPKEPKEYWVSRKNY